MKTRKNYKNVKMSEYKKIYQLYFNEHYSLRKIEEILSIPKSTLSALPLEPYIPRLLFKFKVKDDYHIEYLNRSETVQII